MFGLDEGQVLETANDLEIGVNFGIAYEILVLIAPMFAIMELMAMNMRSTYLAVTRSRSLKQ